MEEVGEEPLRNEWAKVNVVNGEHTSSLSEISPSTASIVQGLSGSSSWALSGRSGRRLSTATSKRECKSLSSVSLVRSFLVQRGVASSPTPTRPRRSIFAGFLAGVMGSLIRG